MNITPENLPLMGIKLIRLALVYLLLGLVLGVGMAASHHFELRPVHTHLNLLGWVTMALSGIIYCLVPSAATTRFASGHYWLHSLGLPTMMVGLTAYSLGRPQFELLIALGALALTLGLLLFAITVHRALGRQSSDEEAHTPETSRATSTVQ